MATLVIPKCPGLRDMERWIVLQNNHEKIVRWKRFCEENPGLRKQTNLHHITSVSSLFVTIGTRLLQYKKFDLALILAAIIFHEDGEAFLRRDISYIHKTNDHDLDEYNSFLETIQDDSKEVQYLLVKAFLLQFLSANKDVTGWGSLAEEAMDDLNENHVYEGHIFNALERMDYLYYTINSYEQCGDLVLLVHLLRDQVPGVEKYIGVIDGFEKEVWTKELSLWAKEVMEICKDLPHWGPNGELEHCYEWAYQNTGVLLNLKHRK